MDWTLKDNMVNSLFFCTTLEGRREAIPYLYKHERKRPTPVRRQLSWTQALLGRVTLGVACRHREVLWGWLPSLHSIGDPPNASHVCCYCQRNWWVVRWVQMGVSIWGAMHLHSMDRWALSGAGVQAPWHGMLETVWLQCDKPQQVDSLQGLEGCQLVWDAGIQSQFARYHWWWGRQDGTCGTRQECSTLQLNAPGLGWPFATLLLKHPNWSQQATSGGRCVMSASCKVTQAVSDTWATCPTLFRGIWAQSKRAVFRYWSWLSAHA